MSKDSKKSLIIRSIIVVIVIIAAVFIYSRFENGNVIALQIDGADVTLNYRKYETKFSFEDVTDIEFMDPVDFGSYVDGGQTSRYKYGTWNNETWGNYELYYDCNISKIIVFTTADSVIVTNYQSDDTTEQLYNALKEYWEQKKWRQTESESS